jgi:hypothetical protein
MAAKAASVFPLAKSVEEACQMGVHEEWWSPPRSLHRLGEKKTLPRWPTGSGTTARVDADADSTSRDRTREVRASWVTEGWAPPANGCSARMERKWAEGRIS